MENHIYQDLIKWQQKHWWFKARRVLLKTILDKYLPPKSLKILEIGCGTGGNLSMLKKYGDVFAMEMDTFAAEYAAKLSGTEIKIGWLPDNIPFTETFDVICLFDVLVHISDDKSALFNASKFLNPGGIIILTVPAHQWLFGVHDKVHHHFRRYSFVALKRLLSIDSMETMWCSHFNFILFPALAVSRLMDKFSRPGNSAGYLIPGKFINALLFFLFSLEKYLIHKIEIPFGGSAFAVLKTKKE